MEHLIYIGCIVGFCLWGIEILTRIAKSISKTSDQHHDEARREALRAANARRPDSIIRHAQLAQAHAIAAQEQERRGR